MEVNGLVLTAFTGNGYENMWGAEEGLLMDGDIPHSKPNPQNSLLHA